VGLLTASLLLAGCNGPPPSRLKFNDKLARNLRQLANDGLQFRKELDHFLVNVQDQPPLSIPNLESLAGTMDRDVQNLLSEADSMSLPRLSQGSASTLLDRYKDYLKVQQSLVKNQVPKIIDVLRTNKTRDQKDAEVRALMKKLDEEETKARGEMERAQTEWAKECNFTLMYRRT
jgi:hypothetical protein